MKVWGLFFWACFWALPVLAASVDIVSVQTGVFEKENCIANSSSLHNFCLCSADIGKPIVSGISLRSAGKINDILTGSDVSPDMDIFTRPDGGSKIDICEGHKVNVDAKEAGEYRSLVYDIVLNKTPFLTLRKSYDGYFLGAAHPYNEEEYYFFNTGTGEAYSYRDLFGDDLKGLNSVVKVYLETHKNEMADMGEDNGESV